jgi:5-methylcytosine-specific restriction endonuclease McrA
MMCKNCPGDMHWHETNLVYVCEDCGVEMTAKDIIEYLEELHPYLKGIIDDGLEQNQGPSDGQLHGGGMYTTA